MELNNKIIYLDYNATTPIDSRVLEAMLPFLKENFANPSSTHHFGVTVNNAVKNSRAKVAELIGAERKEVIFTSGSTEGINIAINGIADKYIGKGKHIITASTEHKAVLDTCRSLETKGYEMTYLPVRKDGIIDLADLRNAIRPDTVLVSVMYVNNETGVIQAIKEIAFIVHTAGSIFMTDATQAVGKLEIDVHDLGVDLLCLSGHKMYAPKGIGALYIRPNIKLSPYIHGGGHENGLRSGTLNVPGIIALGKASEIAMQEMQREKQKITILRNRLENELLKIPDTFLNGSRENRIYNVSNICFRGFDANVMIGRMKNIAVSNGSACTSQVIEPSHVLTAMGLDNDDAFASLRFSLGKFNTENDIEIAIDKINNLIMSDR